MYLFLLFVHMADLEPDVFLGQRTRGVLHDVFETLILRQHGISDNCVALQLTSRLWVNFCCCL
jgi:hypothetical protein